MPKARNPENVGLPSRWRHYHGAYYYQVPKGLEYQWGGKKQFKLGNTLSEAYSTWSDKLERLDNAKNIGQILDRYALEVIPQKAAASRSPDLSRIKKLRMVFGEMPLDSLEPHHIYKYADKRSVKSEDTKKKSGGQSAAKHEISLFSAVLSKAVEWGYINKHPFKGEVEIKNPPQRKRYVEDWEIIECLSLSCKRKKGSVQAVQAWIRLKLLTGLRGTDLVKLRISDLKEDGIHVEISKTRNTTQKSVIYEWTDDLRNAVDLAKSVRPIDISPYLFCTQRGLSYYKEKTGNYPGWDSIWDRFMERVLKETKVTDRFMERDLRAKCASDADREHARQLLAHADGRTTDKYYRRKPEVIKPAK